MLWRDLLERFDKIFFDDVRRGVDHLVRKMAIICDEEEARRLPIEAAYSEEALSRREEVEDNRFLSGTDVRTKKAEGLIEHIVNFFLLSFDARAVDDDPVILPIDVVLREFDGLSIYLDAAREDQLFTSSPGGNPRCGQRLTQSFLFHKASSIKERGFVLNS